MFNIHLSTLSSTHPHSPSAPFIVPATNLHLTQTHSLACLHTHTSVQTVCILQTLSLAILSFLPHCFPSCSPSLLSFSPFSLVGCVQAACSLQLQRASSCDALLATTAGCEETEEDGAGMDLAQLLDRIRAQCHQSSLPGPGERRYGSGLGRAAAAAPVAASRQHGAAVREVSRHFCIVMLGFFP